MSRKKEWIIIGAVVLVALITIVLMICIPKGGTKIVVSCGGQLYGVYDLEKDQTIPIETKEGKNTLKIEGGKAWMLEADCPDQICTLMYPLAEDAPGIIVCLPHELIVGIREK